MSDLLMIIFFLNTAYNADKNAYHEAIEAYRDINVDTRFDTMPFRNHFNIHYDGGIGKIERWLIRIYRSHVIVDDTSLHYVGKKTTSF